MLFASWLKKACPFRRNSEKLEVKRGVTKKRKAIRRLEISDTNLVFGAAKSTTTFLLFLTAQSARHSGLDQFLNQSTSHIAHKYIRRDSHWAGPTATAREQEWPSDIWDKTATKPEASQTAWDHLQALEDGGAAFHEWDVNRQEMEASAWL